MQQQEEKNKIELRSEKVRNIMGEMPPFLVRWGNTVLILVFVLLLVIFGIVVYPVC